MAMPAPVLAVLVIGLSYVPWSAGFAAGITSVGVRHSTSAANSAALRQEGQARGQVSRSSSFRMLGPSIGVPELVLPRRTIILLPAVAAVLGDPLRAAAEGEELKRDMLRLKVGLKGLNYLLDNWDNETTQCNYAQLDRALLAKNKKAELLEAATTNALFDKDNKYMIIKCKRTPGSVKEYLGLASTTDPLYRAPDMIKRCRKLVSDDAIDAYVEAEEAFSQVLSSAGSMTYAAMGGGGRAGAGADFSTFNEFKKGEKQDPRDIQFLTGARRDIEKVRDILSVIVTSLPVPDVQAPAPPPRKLDKVKGMANPTTATESEEDDEEED